MTYAQKYGRTFHFPFSPGATSDDRINFNYWEDISKIKRLIHTEKLDGENNCLNKYGVFARSHAATTISPWTSVIRQRWDLIKNDIGNYEIFGENLYAIHSIEYRDINEHFFVFAVREHDRWLSWEETCFVAGAFDLLTVPVIQTLTVLPTQGVFEKYIPEIASQPSIFGSTDVIMQKQCSREGVVTRNLDEYDVGDFQKNVFKYVRKGHVKTDEHWTRNWKRATLKNERK